MKSTPIHPRLARLLLAFAALAGLGFVVYASLVPLKYTPKSWEETYAQFQKIAWFQLGIDRRADWVANGLIMLPPGFLAAGAVDWGRARRWLLLIATPIIVALLVAVVCAIEFVQIWFPPRVVSQNDIFAGAIGSVGGVLLWWLTGKTLLGQFEQFVFEQPGLAKWKLLMNFGALGLLLYSVMPMDVLLSLEELRDKWNAGHIRIFPFQDFDLNRKSLLFLAIAGARLTPYTFVTTLQSGMRQATMQGIFLAVLLELVKIPIHSRPASVTNVIAGIAGVVIIALSAPVVMRWLVYLDSAFIWLGSAFAWTAVMMVGFLGRFDSIERNPTELAQRFQGILTVPFARAHSSSEFEAGENILVKLIVFGALTFLLTGWCTRLRTSTMFRLAAIVSMLWCFVVGLGIEIAQVFLPPLVPDGTDFIIYALGAVLGILSFRMMMQPLPDDTLKLLPSATG